MALSLIGEIGEARYRTCDPCFTRQVHYPRHHDVVKVVNIVVNHFIEE